LVRSRVAGKAQITGPEPYQLRKGLGVGGEKALAPAHSDNRPKKNL